MLFLRSEMSRQIPCVKLLDGRSMPILGLGTYSNPKSGDREKTEQAVYDAICLGYRHIDTAWLYQVEPEVGRGAKRAIDEGIVKREDLFITTKIWATNMRKEAVLKQAKESNEKLGLGYIDLLLVHFPVPLKDNGTGFLPVDENGKFLFDDVDIHEETWRAMEETVDLGISKSIGVSNYNIRLLKSVLEVARIKPVTNQVESTPYLPQKKLIAFAKEHGVTITAYSPFGGGPRDATFGIKKDDVPLEFSEVHKNLFKDETLNALASKHNKTVSQILLRFHVERGVIVIPKTVTKSRLEENADIFDFSLSPEDLASIATLENGKRFADLNIIAPMADSKYYPFGEE